MDYDRVISEFNAKRHSASDAIFSPCEKYRYALIRNWACGHSLFTDAEHSDEFAAFCCLNPSKADATRNDPTVVRCSNFAKAWGYGGFVMLNAFAYRATDPREMKRQPDPVGPSNDAMLQQVTEMAGIVVAGWGTHANFLGRQKQLLDMLPKHCSLHHLGLTKDGLPSHPLYLKADTQPTLWIPRQ